MMRSMTGYGARSSQKDERLVSVEIRSVNHRFLDLHIRLPREYTCLESELSQLLRAAFTRGRIDVYVAIQTPSSASYPLDLQAARSYVEAAARLRQEFQLEDRLDLRTLLTLPGVCRSRDSATVAEAGIDPVTGAMVRECVRQASGSVLQMREQEGAALADEIRRYLRAVGEKAEAVRALTPRVVPEYQARLRDRLSQLLPDGIVDPQRLAQEAALLAEKSDIAEEVTRLASHLEQCAGLLETAAPAGKQLDFLMQEMHRETNTILSKTTDIDITHLTIEMKGEIERLREQVQNVE